MSGALSRASGLEAAVADQIGSSVPGLAVVVVDPERALLSQTWGMSSLSGKVAMTTDTACNWFSMTKLVTATLALQLHDDGLLDLDAPVTDYWEPFAVTTPTARCAAVRVRHLLAHTSGLANPIPLRWVHPVTGPRPEPGEFVRRQITEHRRLRFEPGTRPAYSNLGYLVLGAVIEAASGRRFETCVEERVLAPLAMDRTGFGPPDGTVWATPYQRRSPTGMALELLLPRAILGPKEGRYRSLRHFCLDGPAYGGLIGPVDDASRFLRAHLRDGELDGARILTEASTRTMRTIGADGEKLRVGYGWYQRGRCTGARYVEHLGGGAGFWNCMRLYTGRGIGVVVMGNASTYAHEAIVGAAVAEVPGTVP